MELNTSGNMKTRLLSKIIAILGSILILRMESVRSCDYMPCIDAYTTSNGNNLSQICSHIQQAELCLAPFTSCGFLEALTIDTFNQQLDLDRKAHNCPTQPPETEPTTATSPTTSSTPASTLPTSSQSCSLPIFDITTSVTSPPEQASIASTSKSETALCPRRSEPRALRQCALYTHSHLRRWSNVTIESCLIPGAWFMVNHHDVMVEIMAEVEHIQSTLTHLSKVNVTFPSTSCNANAHSYVAYRGQDLPQTFIGIGSPQSELHISNKGSVVSILAPWLNFSIIIRNQGGFLSVVTQIDADEMAASEGLCKTGCPMHTRVDHAEITKKKCEMDQNNALLGCFTSLLEALENEVYDREDARGSYYSMCTRDVLTQSSYDIIPFLKAAAKDSNLLQDWKPFVLPDPVPPPEVPITTHNTQSTTTPTKQTTPTTGTMPTTHVITDKLVSSAPINQQRLSVLFFAIVCLICAYVL